MLKILSTLFLICFISIANPAISIGATNASSSAINASDSISEMSAVTGAARTTSITNLDFTHINKDAPYGYKPYESFMFKFDFTDSKINLKQIYNSGLMPDEIPTIRKPRFSNVAKVDYLKNDDYIIGLEVNGELKGYPLSVLGWHSGVNDIIGGRHVFISWDPLSGSVLAFSRMIKGEKNEFGVSGMVYKSTVLYYDQITQSLWSPMAMQSISGEYAGYEMEIIPTFITEWKNFKQHFPSAEILSTDTGFNLDYKAKPYNDYANNKALLFPVTYHDDTLPRKEMVLGVIVEREGKVKTVAFPIKSLTETNKTLEFIFPGQKTAHEDQMGLQLSYDKKLRSYNIKTNDGTTYKAIYCYWFAWSAFYPHSMLVKEMPR